MSRRLFSLSTVSAGFLALACVSSGSLPLCAATGVQTNTVNSVLNVSQNGRHIQVTGPIACSRIQPVFLRVTVTQRSTGAVAESYGFLIGTTTSQQWQVNVAAQGLARFAPGEATVVVEAETYVSFFQRDDAHQWLVKVNLVNEN